uniref:Uncharacterized protein n=1 Tax=Acrobeloides nanus TaxID=290746 RepID=A0A914D3F6_9BILA
MVIMGTLICMKTKIALRSAKINVSLAKICVENKLSVAPKRIVRHVNDNVSNALPCAIKEVPKMK